MHLHTLASPWHQEDWQPSRTSHGAHHIVKHLGEQKGEGGILHEISVAQSQEKNENHSSQQHSEVLIMWFIERDLNCITNTWFIVQYISPPHVSAHSMYAMAGKKNG